MIKALGLICFQQSSAVCEVKKMSESTRVGLITKKIGMTQIFCSETGSAIPVTVLSVLPNHVVMHKTVEVDGYSALQLGFGEKKNSRVSRPMAGHFAKANVPAAQKLHEFPLAESLLENFPIGSTVGTENFSEGQYVDVSGFTRGKGFAGTIKRHNFRGQDNTHGNSLSHRAPGSIGQNQSPGRVFKGKKMSGHMGNAMRTVQNQLVVRVDSERQLIMLKGVVPGAPGGFIILKPAVKKTKAD